MTMILKEIRGILFLEKVYNTLAYSAVEHIENYTDM